MYVWSFVSYGNLNPFNVMLDSFDFEFGSVIKVCGIRSDRKYFKCGMFISKLYMVRVLLFKLIGVYNYEKVS